MYSGLNSKPNDDVLKGTTVSKKPLRICARDKKCIGSMGTPEVFYYSDGTTDTGVSAFICKASVGGVEYGWLELVSE